LWRDVTFNAACENVGKIGYQPSLHDCISLLDFYFLPFPLFLEKLIFALFNFQNAHQAKFFFTDV
jgi:hypothetical protein